jgi:hypothetical protein
LPTAIGWIGPITPPSQPMMGWTVEPATIKDTGGIARRPRIKISCASDMDDVERVWVQVRLKETGDVVFDSDSTRYELPFSWLISGQWTLPNTDYEARGRYLPKSNRPTDWSAWLAVKTPNALIASGDVFDNAIIASKIADAAVTAEKIMDEAVTNLKLADAAVSTARLRVEAVTAEVLASNAVISTKLADAAVTAAKLAAGAIDATKLAFECQGGRNCVDSADDEQCRWPVSLSDHGRQALSLLQRRLDGSGRLDGYQRYPCRCANRKRWRRQGYRTNDQCADCRCRRRQGHRHAGFIADR